MKKLFLIIMACFVAMMTGCAKNGEQGSEFDAANIPQLGGEINLQMRTPDTLDPILTERQTVRDALMVVYEPLFNITDNFDIEPVLAQDWSFSDDAKHLSVTLKSDIRWHNGERLTASDVCFTVNKIMQNSNSSYHESLSKLESVTSSGDNKVIFNLSEPFYQFLYVLYFPIENERADASSTCVGTGPYMVDNVQERQLVLRKYEGWHGGSAYIDTINILYMRSELMAQEAFSASKIDAISEQMLDGENFAIKEGMSRVTYPSGVFEFIGFNTQNGIFANPLIRIAAANSIDRAQIEKAYIEAVASGFPVMSSSAAFSPSYETTSYNLEYAGEVIFSAGWTDLDWDNKPEKIIDNVMYDLSCSLVVCENEPARVEAAKMVKAQLEESGFDVDLQVVSLEEYNSRVSSGNFDAFAGAVYRDNAYDLSPLLKSGGRVNYFGYSDSDMDSALLTLSKASQAEDFSAAFTAVQSLYVASQPLTGLVYRKTAVVTQAKLKGEIKPYPYSPYANISDWYVAES